MLKGVTCDGGTERARGVQRATSPEDAWGGMLEVDACDEVGGLALEKRALVVQRLVGDSPTSSAMKRLNPIPTGAMKFP